MERRFFATSAFTHGCVSGGHTVHAYDVIWTLSPLGRWIGVQYCADCDATRRVMEYAKSKRRARA